MRKRGERPPTSGSAEAGKRFRLGEPRAAEEVRERVRRALAFRGYGIPPEDRLDLEQVVMAQLWEAVAAPRFDPTAGFWGFVEVVAARRCVDWLRKRRDETSLDAAAAPVDPKRDPLGRALRREREQLVRAVLARLPEGCRELIRLHLEEERSYAEAAGVLGASEGALRVRMHRCIQRAQRLLNDLDDSGESGADL